MDIDPLLAAAWKARRAGRLQAAVAHAERVAEALQRDGVPEHEPVRGEVLGLLAGVYVELGRIEDAEAVLERALAGAARHGWSRVMPEALMWRAVVLARGADLREADALLQRAIDAFRGTGDRGSEARAHVERAVVMARVGRWDLEARELELAAVSYAAARDRHGALQVRARQAQTSVRRGELGVAEAALREVLARARERDHAPAVAEARSGLARLELRRGDPLAAREHALEALDAFGAWGAVVGRAEALNLLGETLRQAGDLEAAARACQQSADLFAGAGVLPVVPRMNRALCLLEAGDHGGARPVLEEVLELSRGVGRRPVERAAHLLLLECAATARDADGWADHYERAAQLGGELHPASPDVAASLRRSGLAWGVHRGRSPTDRRASIARAVRAHALSLDQWQHLGEGQRARTERAALEELRDRAPVPAGPFDLLEPLGEGSMGEVWRARHHTRGTEVAVKVLRSGASTDPNMRSIIEGELRAAAGLDHPNIVAVLDHGVLGPEVPALTAGGLVEGSPWFAMELADSGALDGRCGRLAWADCYAVLFGLLDALAHAHARGVVHLDLKPGNVLLHQGDQGLRVLLADFGLAGVLARRSGVGVAGTPWYMAPEQFRGEDRDYGPWTDLYALGCLAAHLVQGDPLYPGDGVEVQRNAHLELPIPDIHPVIGLPDGFHSWLHRLLQKEPSQRYQRAADAAWGLRCLQAPPRATEPPDSLPPGVPTERVSARTWVFSYDEPVQPTEEASSPRALGSGQPPFPVSWRAPRRPRPHDTLIGSGLRLFQLRRLPVVARSHERGLLWALLREVVHGRVPRLAALLGPEGSGRTSLLRWLAERGAECGAVQVMHGRPLPGRSSVHGLVVGDLHLEGLSRPDAVARARQTLPELAPRIAGALAVLATDGVGALRPEDAIPAVLALVEARAQRRPVLLHLEGRPWEDPVALGLVRAILDEGPPVMVCVEGGPRAMERGASAWEALLDHPDALVLELGLLDRGGLELLASALLPLRPELMDRLVRRAAGRPQFLVELVSDLVERAVLVPGPEGYGLQAGAELQLPPALAQLWRGRVERVLEGLSREARTLVAVCALLGEHIDAASWRLACELVDVAGPSAVVRRLRGAGLARSEGRQDWVFEHPTVQTLVGEAARAEGTFRRACTIAAEVLEARGGDPGRVGVLFAEGGQLEQAVEPLVAGARLAVARGDTSRASELLDRRAASLYALGAPSDDARWAGEAVLRAEIALDLEPPSVARRWAARAVTLTEEHTLVHLLPDAWAVRAAVVLEEGEVREATRLLRRALRAFSESRDVAGQARCLYGLAEVARRAGDLDTAEARLRAVLSHAERAGLTRWEASALISLGRVDITRGHLELAARSLDRGLEVAQRSGRTGLVRAALHALGHLARASEDVDGARALFEQALQRSGRSGSVAEGALHVDLALLHLAAGHDGEAARALDEAERAVDRGPVLAWTRVARLPLVATAVDPAWAQALDDALQGIDEGAVGSGAARCFELAAARAEGAGLEVRARVARDAALGVWRRLGRTGDTGPVAHERLPSR